jgi:hypothetical protein
MRSDAEVACDELALSFAGSGEAKRYGRLIIRMAEALSGLHAIVPDAAAMAGSKWCLRRRLSRIARDGKPGKVVTAIAAAVFIFFSACILTAADTSKAGLLEEIRNEIRTAQVHIGALQELEQIAEKAEHNLDAISKAGYIISHAGYNTGGTLEIARAAAASDRDMAAFNDLVELSVLIMHGPPWVEELANHAAKGGINDADLNTKIAALRGQAELKTLDEALAFTQFEMKRTRVLEAIKSEIQTGKFHKPALEELEKIAKIARIAAVSDREIAAFDDLVELSVLMLTETRKAVDLTRQAYRGEIGDADLWLRIESYRAAAELKSLDQAIVR